MKVVIMGGGIIGLTTAWYLQREGHEITVIERHAECGTETSFQNGALLAPGHSQAWASPGAFKTLVKSLFQDDPALRFRISVDPRFIAWNLKFLGQCTAPRYRANTLRILRVMMRGVDQLRQVREEADIPYDANDDGILYLFRSQHSLDTYGPSWTLLAEHGFRLEAADRNRCVEIEPTLGATKDKIAGGFFAPDDGAGDAFIFCRNMAARLAGKGAEFKYGTTIRAIRASGRKVEAVVTDKGEVTGDAYVMALGPEAPFIGRTAGLKLPIWPIKGYTVSVPIGDHKGAPRTGIIEEDNLVAFAHLGDRLRVGGKAEFAGYDKTYRDKDFRGVFKVARDLFPDGADYGKPTYYACLRPVTPDGPPILGRSPHDNLFLNVGHGAAGWTESCSCAEAVAATVMGKTPAMDMEGLEYDRYR
jgi:D-amino-acid dehydrogenase